MPAQQQALFVVGNSIMTSKIATLYSDKVGSIDAEITNDFQKLELNVDGTKFVSYNFHDFVPVDSANIPSRFMLKHHNELTNCVLLCKIPLIVKQLEKEIVEFFTVELHLDSNGTTYNTYGNFRLSFDKSQIEIGKTQHFESAFEILKSKLSETVYPKCCYTCLYSDYSVYGSAIFGTMLCFRNIKKEYLNVKSKDEYMEIMDQREMQIQEIYLCKEFEKRIEGTGYRG
jgi:Family of unknown function (DUF6304)